MLALLRWMADPEGCFRDDFAEYGDIYAVTNPLYGRQVVLNHPELIRQVFTGDPDVFCAGAANFALMPVVGDLAVLVLDGRPHHRLRKLLLPAFTGERLAGYGAVMKEATTRAIAKWPDGEPLGVLPTMQDITFDVILKTIFGVSDGASIDLLRTRLLGLIDRAQSPTGMLWLLPAFQKDLGPLTGWAAMKRAIGAADDAIYAVIAEARASQRPDRRDVLSTLLTALDDDGKPMSDQELRDQLMTLLLAGNETTALSLAWAIDEIYHHPAVLERLLAELEESDGVDALPYLDATIKEVLRLHPVTPLLARKLSEPIRLRDHDVRAGTFVIPNVYSVHRHPDFWPEPEAFKPERFLDRKIDPYAWLPFGGGARRCIGMGFALLEMRVVLATILRELVLSPDGPPAKIALRSFLIAPKGGGRVVVRGRRGGDRPAVGRPMNGSSVAAPS